MIYEAHVKGMTMRHPKVPKDVRGTYAGLAHPAMIQHFQQLGVTAVELMPVHQFVHDSTLAEQGLRNYWGYNTIGFFAPHNGYASFGTRGEQVLEFKAMVRALHQAGIEVILDVVYNHTAEGNHLGPTLSFRGIDNQAYYRLVDGDPQHYYDTTGTGNSLNVRHHESLRLIMDSLRYWVTEMHVDGFRFDLASALAREFHEVDRLSAFFDLVNQDPVVSQVKLIAEPWDVGEGGYQVGGFPPLWTEWNGKYRDTVRDFWRGEPASLGEFAAALHRLVRPLRGRQPPAHRLDQLRHRARRVHPERPGLLQREAQRGQRRGQPGRGEPQPVLELRRRGPDRGRRGQRAARAAEAQLPDHPAALPGRADDRARRRAGPHPAGQQQRLLPGQRAQLGRLGRRHREHEILTEFTARLAALRRAHPVFRRQRFFQGRPIRGSSVDDIAWLRPDGQHDDRAGLERRLRPHAGDLPQRPRHPGPQRARRADHRRLVPAADQRPPRAVTFTLPDESYGRTWEIVVDTADPLLARTRRRHPLPGGRQRVPARAMRVLQCRLLR